MKPSVFLKLAAVALLTVATVTGCKKTPKNVTPLPGARTSVDNVATKPTGGLADASTPSKGPLDVVGSGLPAGNPQYPSGNNLNTKSPGNDVPPVFTQQIPAKQGGGDLPPVGEFEGMLTDRSAFAANTLHFDYDKAIVRASELGKLQPVIAALKASPQNKLLIEGHCDERGTEEYNRALGERRALAIRERLAKAGISPDRLRTVTYGEDKPSELGHTESAWAKNRRGELVLLKPPGL